MHEVAHACIAAHLGIAGEVVVIRNPTGGRDSKHFHGYYRPLADPSAREWELIAVAGIVGELFDDNAAIEAVDVMEEVWADDNLMSATDENHAGKMRLATLTRCLRLVRKYWPRIVERAEALAGAIDGPPLRMDWTTFRVKAR